MTTPQPDATAEVAVDPLHRRDLDTLDTLGIINQEVHAALNAAAAALTVVREHIEHGGKVSDFTDLIKPELLRTSLSTSLEDLERARHQAQRLLFKILKHEGKSTTNIARAWGISRQLVSRLNEPDNPVTAGLAPAITDAEFEQAKAKALSS